MEEEERRENHHHRSVYYRAPMQSSVNNDHSPFVLFFFLSFTLCPYFVVNISLARYAPRSTISYLFFFLVSFVISTRYLKK